MATQQKKEVRVGSIVSCAYLHQDKAPVGIVLSIEPPLPPHHELRAAVKWFNRQFDRQEFHRVLFLYELRLIKQ